MKRSSTIWKRQRIVVTSGGSPLTIRPFSLVGDMILFDKRLTLVPAADSISASLTESLYTSAPLKSQLSGF